MAGLRSKVAEGEIFLAITRTVLFDQAVESSSTKRVEVAYAAPARPPCWLPVTVTSSKLAAPGVTSGRS